MALKRQVACHMACDEQAEETLTICTLHPQPGFLKQVRLLENLAFHRAQEIEDWAGDQGAGGMASLKQAIGSRHIAFGLANWL